MVVLHHHRPETCRRLVSIGDVVRRTARLAAAANAGGSGNQSERPFALVAAASFGRLAVRCKWPSTRIRHAHDVAVHAADEVKIADNDVRNVKSEVIAVENVLIIGDH